MSVGTARKHRIQTRIICPHCWQTAAPENVLWISSHPGLLGDPKLTALDAQQRFLPERFNAAGEAIDSRGQRCQKLACPYCHLILPWASVELQPIFMSILGAPSSGKSVFLGALTSQLRSTLFANFGLAFSDADLKLNALVNEYENGLHSIEAEETGSNSIIESKIRKTQIEVNVSKVRMDLGGEVITLPSPFVFVIQPGKGHIREEKGLPPGRLLCLYDTGGEAFEAKNDLDSLQVTRHLGRAQALLIVIDPTQEQRFQKAMKSADCVLPHSPTLRRQEPYVQEAFRRIFDLAKLRVGERFQPPVIVIVNKYDSWRKLLPNIPASDPWRKTTDGYTGLLTSMIDDVSDQCKDLMKSYCPDIVNSIEQRANNVRFVPVSAAGLNTVIDPQSGRPALPSGEEADRFWVTVPFLVAIQSIVPTFIPRLKKIK